MKTNKEKLMQVDVCAEAQFTQAAINSMFGFTEETIINMLLDEGSTYLNEYFRATPNTANRMKGDPFFWSWWRKEWHVRNLQFWYDEGRSFISREIQYYMYLTSHNGKNLASELHPQPVYMHHLNTHPSNHHANF